MRENLSGDSGFLDLIRRLRDRLGPERVLTGADEFARHRYLFSWPPLGSTAEQAAGLGEPGAVIRPDSTADVALVLKDADAAGVPVVPYGGGTGVMGGARPIAGGLVLDLGALNRILEVNASDLVARVEPGVLLADLAQAADARDLLFAHDPWSRKIATVGGAVGTNGVGYLAAGYGPMGEQVRGLEVVLAGGQVVSWSSAAKAVGPDVWRMFVGSEGTLGVITRVDVQLYPRPETRRLVGYRFPTFPEGFYALTELRRQGLQPTMIDYEEAEDGRVPLESPANLFLAFDGARAVAGAAAGAAGEICLHHDAQDLGEAAAQSFWEHRHDVAEWFASRPPESWRARGARFPDVYVNLTVPLGRVLDYAQRVVEIARGHEVRVASFGIWGRLEFLSFTLSIQGTTTAGEALDEATDAVLRLARQNGGTIEYCHGAGARLAHLCVEEFGPAGTFLETIKHALDPKGILNPGKLGLGLREPPNR